MKRADWSSADEGRCVKLSKEGESRSAKCTVDDLNDSGKSARGTLGVLGRDNSDGS